MPAVRLHFTYLPSYARFIREQKLDAFVRRQLQIAREQEIPLLRFFNHFSEEELVNFGKTSAAEFLLAIESNSMEAYMERSVQSWVNNQLPMLSREQIVAEDITSISLMRRRTFRSFVQDYTADLNLIASIMDEFDGYIAEFEARSFNTYLALQNEEINKINETLRKSNTALEEVQTLARLGSFEWYMGRSESILSPMMRQIFGLEGRGTLAEFFRWVHPDDREKVKAALEQAYNDPNGIYECEYRYQKDGPEKVLLSRGVVSFENGQPAKIKGTVMDITDRHRMITRLQESEAKLGELNRFLGQKNDELQRKNQELESFNYAISHDLQEPLRKIQVFCSILKDAPQREPESQRTTIEKIHMAATRLRKLIDDLFSFSFILTEDKDAGEQADANAILQDVINDYQLIIADKKAVIHAGQLPVLQARPTLVYQLLQNLLSNAIKYGKAGIPPEIDIRYEKVNGEDIRGVKADPGQQYHAISISDNGIGIEAKYNEKIFSLFQRLHNRREYSGTGIGLAMCRKIMDYYQGFITVNSSLNNGAVFTVYFPAD
ncbi:MAG: PAS domain-containing protein [Chitinophagaceae bacterium]|nr:PAS domain-containing protein [Chitinophagaceae bacterium]